MSGTSAAFEAWTARARAVRTEDEIARRGMQLKHVGTEHVGPCPKCGGEDRFAVNAKKRAFHCRGCDVGGDVIKLVEHLDACDFVAACTTLAGEPPPKPNGKDAAAGPRKVVAAEYPYEDEGGGLAFVVERIEWQNANGGFVFTKDGNKRKKTFRQKRPDPERTGEWLWNIDGVPVVPYRLPELIGAVADGRTILIVEGEAKADLLWSWNIPATCCAGGAKKWRAEHSDYLRGADVVLVPDNDDAGWAHVNEAGASLIGVAERVRVLVLPGLPLKGDIQEWVAVGGTREQLDALIEQASEWQPPPTATDKSEDKAKAAENEQKLIDELARLNARDYDKRRKEAANELGIRRSTLDGEVAARRSEQAEEARQPPLFGHWEVEPWSEPVETSALIASLFERIRRHIVLSENEALTVALWILFAWVHDAAAVHSPILLVTSAEANSGKTQLLSIIGFLLPRALPCVEISEATLFRGIEVWRPSIIVDEADVILINNEPLRAVINSGWTRGAVVPRCIGDDNTPHAFPTFCPKAVGMKGKRLPDTTLSRSITIEMRRKKAGERVGHFRSIDDAGLAQLRRQALRWASDNGEKLKHAEPEMPVGFDNQLGDNWHLMLAIADVAGDGWPEQARKAAMKLSKVADTSSTGARLLADIRAIFCGTEGDQPLERISSADLAATLGANVESLWAEWKGGKPITQAQLARVLKPFGIVSEVIRLPSGGTLRGYLRSQFEDAWDRYL